MSEEDVIERWLQRGWERLRGVTGRGARTDLSPLSTEAYDLLRQVERGLELRARAPARPRPPIGTALDEVSSLAPLSTGLRRVRKAARPRPGGGDVAAGVTADGADKGDD
jgi:hypothetical protein